MERSVEPLAHMKLPLSITPCPIADAVVEVRFETDVPEEAVLGVVYQVLKTDFPKSTALPIASFPAEVRKTDPNLASQPLHRLEGEYLTVMVGAQSVTVGIRGAYPGWATVSERFRRILERVAATGLIGKPRRFGLRYINFFSGDIFQKLTLSVAIDGKPAIGDGTHFKTVLSAEGCRLLLQVGKDLMLVSEKGKTGSVIDIDSFVTEPEEIDGFDAALAAFLERAHLAEKRLFFSLLKPDFLDALSPTYTDAD